MKRVFQIPALLRRFRDDATATISVEAVLVVPFIVWAFLGVFTIAEGFRTLYTNVNSSYALGDALSRETGAVNAAYINGLNTLHKALTRTTGNTDVRVTVLRYDDSSTTPELVWSYATGSKSALVQADVTSIDDEVPQLAPGESVIVLETWSDYFPLTSYMIDPMEFHSLVVTRPRFAPQLVWQSS